MTTTAMAAGSAKSGSATRERSRGTGACVRAARGLTILAILLAGACGGNEPKSGADPAGAAGSAPTPDRPAPTGRMASVHRLAAALPAEAGGMVRFPGMKGRVGESTRQVEVQADYGPDPKQLMHSIRVRIHWYGQPLAGREKLGFALYQAEKTTLEGFDAVQRNSDEEDSESQLQVRLHDRLILRATSETEKLDAVRKLVTALPLTDLARQAESGKLFEPTASDLARKALLEKDEIQSLMPGMIDGGERQSVRTTRTDDALGFLAAADALYAGFGQVKLTDYGNAETARERAPADFSAMGQVAAWMRAPGREVDRTAFEQDGVPVRLARIAGGNGIDRIVMRAAVGRFVIDYSGPFLTDASGLSDEEAKLRGLRRFGSPKAQVVKVLSAFPLANLKSR